MTLRIRTIKNTQFLVIFFLNTIPVHFFKKKKKQFFIISFILFQINSDTFERP
jgi:hypothetical protein